MSFYRFPSNFVYWCNLDENDHKRIKEYLVPKIEEEEKNNEDRKDVFKLLGSGANTNYNKRLPCLYEKDILKTVVWDPVDDCIKKHNETDNFKISLKNSSILNAWYTSYKKGDFFERHHHKGFPIIPHGETEYHYPTFSLIYILKDENKESSVVFTDTVDYKFTPDIDVEFDTGHKEDIKEGTVLVFPAHLVHAVRKVTTDKRITVAYNIGSTFKSS
jgi:hypothetical protein